MTLGSYLTWWKQNLLALRARVVALLPQRKAASSGDVGAGALSVQETLRLHGERLREQCQAAAKHSPQWNDPILSQLIRSPIDMPAVKMNLSSPPEVLRPKPLPPGGIMVLRSPRAIFVARGDRWFCRDKGHPIHGFAVVSKDPPQERCYACPSDAQFAVVPARLPDPDPRDSLMESDEE